MEESKRESLSKLYFLRALLSKISCMQDKIEEAKEVAKNRENEIEKCKDIIKNLDTEQNYSEEAEGCCDEWLVPSDRKYGFLSYDNLGFKAYKHKTKENVTLKYDENESVNIRRKLNIEISNLRHERWKRTQKEDLLKLALLVFFKGVVPILLLVLSILGAIAFYSKIWPIPLALAALIAFICWVKIKDPFWDIEWEIKYQHHPNQEKKNAVIKELAHTIQSLKNKLEIEEQKEKGKRLSSLSQAKRNLTSAINELSLAKNNSKKSENELFVLCKDTNQFATTVIDERDWGNLDIIIYELETGRADTIKEALQQTDLYIRHGEIVGLIKAATEAICSTIRNSIDDFSRSFKTEISLLRADISEMNDSVGSLLNEQELSNALLKKANVSSQELAKDVARIRQLHDFDFYGVK